MDELSLQELEVVAGGAIPIITGGPVLGARVPCGEEGPVLGSRERCDEEGPVLGSRDPAKIPVKTA